MNVPVFAKPLALPFIHLSTQRPRSCLRKDIKAKWSRLKSCRSRVKSTEDEIEGPVLQPLDESSQGGLGGTSETVFGPLAVLLVGFPLKEVALFREMLSEMDAEAVKLLSCSESSFQDPLSLVFEKEESEFQDPPFGVRRTVFLSGMYASEVNEILSAYRDFQFPPAVFAAYIPKNKDKRLCDLVEEVYDDHQYMIEQRRKNV